jgi:MFS family permease
MARPSADRSIVRLALALFAVQSGFHGFTASLPLALARARIENAEIGLIVGIAALVQVPAALAGGALVDRFSGRRTFGIGGAMYLLGCALLLLPGAATGVSIVPLALARVCQGVGAALTLPAALSLVPALVAQARRGVGLAFVGASHNLTLVVLPPLSIAVLDRSSLAGVVGLVGAFVVAGLIIAWRMPASGAGARSEPSSDVPRGPEVDRPLPTAAQRWLGFAWRRSWAGPILVIVLYVAHWGVVTAYLPQRAGAFGADIGLFFSADGLAILLLRVPSGWLADRVAPALLIAAGLAVTAVAIGLLLLQPTTPLLVVTGILTGGGAGLILTPLLVELSHRSDDADRGSAFALFSAALAGGMALGSIGLAPLVATAGFEAAILATVAGLAAAIVVAVADRGQAAPRPGLAS